MTVRNKIRLIVYRMHEKGLEILTSQDSLSFLEGTHIKSNFHAQNINELIQFNTQDQDGFEMTNLAIEADWHEIPKVRTMLKHDIKLVKDTIWQLIPDLTDCTYLAAKKPFAKRFPMNMQLLKN